MKTICIALALTAIRVGAVLLEDATTEYVEQVSKLPLATDPPPGDVCEFCNEYHKCKNGTCCLRPRSRSGVGYSAICKPLGQRGDLCSEAPTKDDIYLGSCPCMPGLRCRHVKSDINICVSGN
ncbi:venom protein 164-like [Ixodes scapularis]|uniref:venom protein 164-like n=1 Tax=Ixodes scapularis TaxID=6945 RepID=UPI001A9FF283|nr:venom protein 164-like [Ixodes scapularis]